jgi:hypothetical protein
MSESAKWGIFGLAAAIAALALGPYIGFWGAEALLLVAGVMFFVLASKLGGYGMGAARKRRRLQMLSVVLTVVLMAIPATVEWRRDREVKTPQILPQVIAAAPAPSLPVIEPRELRDAAREGAKEGAREVIEKQTEDQGNPQGSATIIAQAKKPPVLHVRYTSSSVVSNIDAAPHGLRVVVQTDVPITGASFRLVFTGPIRFADFRYTTTAREGVAMSTLQGMFKKVEGDTFSFGFAAPAFVPEQPIIVTVFSAAQVAVKSLSAELP